MWVPGRQTGNPCSCLPDPSATWPTNAAQASRAACAANGSEHKRQTGSACMFPAPIHCGREGDGHRGDPPTSALLPFRQDDQTDESLLKEDWLVNDAQRVVPPLKEIPSPCQIHPTSS